MAATAPGPGRFSHPNSLTAFDIDERGRDERLLGLGAAPRELIEEVQYLVWLRRDLPGQDHVTVLVAERDWELPLLAACQEGPRTAAPSRTFAEFPDVTIQLFQISR